MAIDPKKLAYMIGRNITKSLTLKQAWYGNDDIHIKIKGQAEPVLLDSSFGVWSLIDMIESEITEHIGKEK
jgi:hypothetical protein